MVKLDKGSIYKVIEVAEGSPCQNCTPCLRLRLMEMGFICGETVKVKNYQLGIYILSVLSHNGQECSTIAMRDDEASRIRFQKL